MLNIYNMQALETEQKTKHQNTVPRLHEVYSGRRDKANRRWHTHTRQLTEGHRARGGETQATGGEGAFLEEKVQEGWGDCRRETQRQRQDRHTLVKRREGLGNGDHPERREGRRVQGRPLSNTSN